jgi:hypothetical protein
LTRGSASGSRAWPCSLAEVQPDALRQLLEQSFLVLEVPVEETLGDPRGAHDVDHARLGVAVLGEQPRGAVQQLLLALEPLGGQPTVRFHGKSVPRT